MAGVKAQHPPADEEDPLKELAKQVATLTDKLSSAQFGKSNATPLKDDREWTDRGGVYARKRGPASLSLQELSMPDYRYLPLVNYRRYRLPVTNAINPSLPDHSKLLKMWDNFKSELGSEFTFDGEDPAFIIHFLYSVTDLLEQRGYNEATAFNFLPRLLKGNAKMEFQSARTASATSARPVNDWPSAVNYLLEVYAQYQYLTEAEADLKR